MAVRKKGIETREKIISESLQLFSVHGYHNTSINDILDATKLTKGGLYGHFSNKESIWEAVYEEAGKIWRDLVFRGVRDIEDPIERLERVIEADMEDYLGANIFKGGCFFLNMLVELSGQSQEMAEKVWEGFDNAARLFAEWLAEAERKELIRPGLDHRGIATFILISLNGAAALYAPTKDPTIWQETIRQLRAYLRQLRR